MVTANDDVAAALFGRLNESLVMTDINSCCEYLNTRDFAKRNIHGVVGYGMGGTHALRFACQRKRLRAAVSYYGHMVKPPELMKELFSPLLYHQAGGDPAGAGHTSQLQAAAAEYGKKLEVFTYQDAPYAFTNEMKPDLYRPDATTLAWERTAAFLKSCFLGT
jgi:carboxymethylenebutenolidase